MATIYASVQGIRKPAITSNWQGYEKRAEAYVDKIKAFARKHSKCPEAGKEISFGVADGKARYVILSLKPVELVHLDIYDGYRFPYINRLTAQDVKNELKQAEALDKLFSRRGGADES